MKLNPINIHRLTILEAGQFVNRQLIDIRTLGGPELFTDDALNDYLSDMNTRLEVFNDAMMVVRKSDATIKIEVQDTRRDQAFYILKKTAAFYELSSDADQREAALSLNTLFKVYKNLETLNYQAESLGI